MAETKVNTNDRKPPRHRHRHLRERIVVTGQMELTTPSHFGNGDADELTDMPLLVEEVNKQALITGASLAGALRNYLRERQWGYELPMPSRDMHSPFYREWNETENDLLATKLFGGHRGDEKGAQSSLIVDDALSDGEGRPEVELRDGVKIDPKTRSAQTGKKYDFQLLPAGARFNLRFELLLDDNDKENDLRKKALAIALQALAEGEIRLGARKRRGFGCCRVAGWTVMTYDLSKPKDLLAWLKTGFSAKQDTERNVDDQPSRDIASLLGVRLTEADLIDRRDWFEIEADFEIDGSLIVRGGFDEQDRGPDVVHLSTNRNRGRKPVLPGTSTAGAIRHRALRIANTLAGKGDDAIFGAREFIGKMFGREVDRPKDKDLENKKADRSDEEKIEPRASRVVINEELIMGGQDLVQTRIKLDRFTGGTIEAALLEEAPHFGGGVKLRLRLRNPEDAEVGLLLLVLKDLWLGDLPLGGESNIGRGRLRGVKAKLRHSRRGETEMSDDSRNGDITLTGENAAAGLEAYVGALQRVNWEKIEK